MIVCDFYNNEMYIPKYYIKKSIDPGDNHKLIEKSSYKIHQIITKEEKANKEIKLNY
jgi:hypothetical protein